MTYQVDISSTASAEADAAYLQFSQFVEIERAQEWYRGLVTAIHSLQKMPYRCALARENASFSQEIRQLIYGKGKSTYRIIFTVDRRPAQPFEFFISVMLHRKQSENPNSGAILACKWILPLARSSHELSRKLIEQRHIFPRYQSQLHRLRH